MSSKSFYTLFAVIAVLFVMGSACEKKFRDQLAFDDPGFSVSDYALSPQQELIVEAVNINTPSGFQSVTAQLTGEGVLSSAVRTPDAGNEKNGYARFLYTAPSSEATERILISVTEADGTKHTKTITIRVSQKDNFPTVVDFLENTRYKFNDIYYIARASDLWVTEIVERRDGEDFIEYGFKSPLWTGTFFTVPDGTLDPILDLIVYENTGITQWSDLDPNDPVHTMIANFIAESLSMRSRVASGTRAFPPDSLGIEAPKGFKTLGGTFGNMKINVEDFTVGQVGRSSNPETGVQQGEYYPRTRLQTVYDTIQNDSVIFSFRLGGGYGYNLKGFYADIENLDGAVESINTLRANRVMNLMGVTYDVMAGLNGFDPTYNLTAARDNFYGSGYWRGTMFVPYNDLIVSVYENQNSTNDWGITDFVDEWTWSKRAEISQDQLTFMMNFWGSHNLKDVTTKSLSGAYSSNNGTETLVVVGNNVSRVKNEEVVASAKIVKSVRFFDGGSDVFKVIHVIDDVLWVP